MLCVRCRTMGFHPSKARPNRQCTSIIPSTRWGALHLVVKRLMGFVSELKARGVGILLIEQFTDMALKVAENALVLRCGEVRFSGEASRLRGHSEELDRAYFGTGKD